MILCQSIRNPQTAQGLWVELLVICLVKNSVDYYSDRETVRHPEKHFQLQHSKKERKKKKKEALMVGHLQSPAAPEMLNQLQIILNPHFLLYEFTVCTKSKTLGIFSLFCFKVYKTDKTVELYQLSFWLVSVVMTHATCI